MGNSANPAMDGVFSAVRSLLIGIGLALAANGVATNSPVYRGVQIAAGSIMFIGPAGWSLYLAITHALTQRKAVAVGVQAGINLVVAGQALTNGGKLIQIANPDATPPKPVTEYSAQQIVRNFAPPAK
jgi:hypothetical protein